MNIVHKSCGGTLVVNISPMYVIKSPSISLSVEGIIPEMVDITVRSMKKFPPTLICTKCREEFTAEEGDEVEVQCLICSKNKPANSTVFAKEIGTVCNECMTLLTTDVPPSRIPEYIKRIKMWVTLPKKMSTVLVSEIIKNVIV